MYFNVISFKNGKTLGFQSETPYSVEKTANDWSVVTDAKTGQILSFRGSEVVTIATAKAEPKTENKTDKKKKPALKTSVETE